MYCPNQHCPDLDSRGIPGEYRDELSVCPKCGTSLVGWLPPWATDLDNAGRIDGVHEFEGFVPVESVSNRALIPLVHSLLSAAGIRYFIRDEKVLHMLPYFTGALVLVEPTRADEARELLSDLGTEGNEPNEPEDDRS